MIESQPFFFIFCPFNHSQIDPLATEWVERKWCVNICATYSCAWLNFSLTEVFEHPGIVGIILSVSGFHNVTVGLNLSWDGTWMNEPG